MVQSNCERIRTRLALGEPRTRDDERHLASCADCRVEADRVGLLLARLGDGPEVEIPAVLDRMIRDRLAGPAIAAARAFPRPSLAAGLAVGGLFAMTAALAGVLAQTGAAEGGAYLGLVIALGYTTVSAAATIPLLMMRGTLWPASDRGVRR